MILKSLKLRNIRSYTNERIDFPEGTTLLSGDIGSGKSTILMAADFALFGLKKGELQGSDLLRHGKNEGIVELEFESEGRNFAIRRVLKRSRSILQDTGSIFIDGLEYSMSPNELKAKVMEMLGYAKQNIFRYTVYTPQEEMKSILFNAEARLEVLRNVFEVDKYMRIKSNAKLLLAEIRSMKRGFDAFSKDIGEKENLLNLQKNTLSSARKELSAVTESLDSINRKNDGLRNSIMSMKAGYEEAVKIKSDLGKKESDLKGAKSRHAKIVSDINEISKSLEESASLLDGHEKIDISLLRDSADEADASREKILAKKAVVSKEKENLINILERKFCNVCGQEVANPEGFRKKISRMEEEISELEEESRTSEARSKSIRDMIIKSHKMEIIQKNYAENKRWLERLSGDKESLENSIDILENEILLLKPKSEEFDIIERKIRLAENELYLVQDEKLKAEKAVSRLEQQIEDAESSIRNLEHEIMEKLESKEKSARLSEIDSWTESYFVPLMDVIEKNVLANIQMEFDRFFQQWFGVLMGDQLSVRIDDKFTPIIEQNGYETDYNNLSGGEKTSVALAYRLALNKTINLLSDNIKTKDIIILDEPTDGFSTEQLDRIRDVISQLSLRQIIIVSHEPKIDTFVDNVIKIYKEDHVSKVI